MYYSRQFVLEILRQKNLSGLVSPLFLEQTMALSIGEFTKLSRALDHLNVPGNEICNKSPCQFCEKLKGFGHYHWRQVDSEWGNFSRAIGADANASMDQLVELAAYAVVSGKADVETISELLRNCLVGHCTDEWLMYRVEKGKRIYLCLAKYVDTGSEEEANLAAVLSAQMSIPTVQF